MIRTSGSTAVAIENPSRARMPDEYVLIGASMNSPMSAKSTMPGSRSSMTRCGMPRNAPARRMLSRPERSASKPAPSVSRLETWPTTSTAPSFGWMMPARTWSSVLLPAPFGPMTARLSPWTTRNETSRRAQKWVGPSRFFRRSRNEVRTVVWRVRRRL